MLYKPKAAAVLFSKSTGTKSPTAPNRQHLTKAF